MSLTGLVALAFLQLVLLRFIPDDRVNLIAFGLLVTAGLACFFDWTGGYIGWPRFIVGLVLIAFGYAVSQALVLVVFSKLLAEQEQGVMMGWLSSSAAVARMICPPAAGYAWNGLGTNGHNYVFLGAALITALANFVLGIFFTSLKPRVTASSAATINA